MGCAPLSTPSAATAPRAVAIEAQPANADLLRKVVSVSGLGSVVDVVNAGASNVTGTLKLTPIRHAGVETGHIAETGRKAGGRAKAERTISLRGAPEAWAVQRAALP